MPRKNKSGKLTNDGPLPAVASMKFWSRFTNPSPMLAFPFSESPDLDSRSLEPLMSLPSLSSDSSVAYSLRISLNGAKPPVWRRVLINDINLEQLHHVIQVVMGWEDSHLHGFEIRKTYVPLAEDGAEIDERKIFLSQLNSAKIKKFQYTYDFGDDWQHTIEIEEVVPSDSTIAYPQCSAGKGACPIEDVGGMLYWAKLLEILQHPDAEVDE